MVGGGRGRCVGRGVGDAVGATSALPGGARPLGGCLRLQP